MTPISIHASQQVLALFHHICEMAPHKLTDELEATIKILVVIKEHSQDNVNFADWANNTIKRDGTPLFGKERGLDSLFYYCRQGRFKNLKESYRSFCRGNYSAWTPLTRADCNPLVWLQDKPPIRALTEDEFKLKSTRGSLSLPKTPPKSTNMMRRSSRSNTPVRNGRGKAKIDNQVVWVWISLNIVEILSSCAYSNWNLAFRDDDNSTGEVSKVVKGGDEAEHVYITGTIESMFELDSSSFGDAIRKVPFINKSNI